MLIVVSTWSALLNVGQIVTFTHIGWFADKFGRKASFYLAWVWLVVVSQAQLYSLITRAVSFSTLPRLPPCGLSLNCATAQVSVSSSESRTLVGLHGSLFQSRVSDLRHGNLAQPYPRWSRHVPSSMVQCWRYHRRRDDATTQL